MSDSARIVSGLAERGASPAEPEPMAAAARWGALWEHSPDGLILLNASEVVVACNAVATRLLGTRPGEPFFERFHSPDGARACVLKGTQRSSCGGCELREGGAVLLHAAPVSEGPEAGCTLIQARSCGSLRASEAEMAELRRLALLGQLAASIANAINNPLAVILGRIELFSEIPDAASLPAHLAVIAEHAQRVAGIVDAMSVFARPAEGNAERIPILDLLNAARRGAGQRINSMRVDIHTGAALRVYGHRAQLEQALTMLLNSAAEAMHRRGALALRAEARGDLVVVGYHIDGGASLPPRLREQMERSLQSREMANSTLNLGIVASANLIRQGGGRIFVLTGAAGEPLFRVELPSREGPVVRGGPVQILGVDSDGSLLAELRRACAGLNAVLAEAHDQTGALSALLRVAPDLIVTAPELSDGSAIQLRSLAAQRWPGVEARVVVALPERAWEIPGVRSIRRPLQPEQLADLIRREE